VTSGEPEGVAAAVAAARNGMRTLLIERGDALGGLMTLGMLNILDNSYAPVSPGTWVTGNDALIWGSIQNELFPKQGSYLLTQGIFNEFYQSVGDAFDIQEAKDWFWNATQNEPNLTVMLNTEIIAPVMSGITIVGLEILAQGNSETEVVRSLAVIDSTVDGDIAAAAGAPYTWGGADYGAEWVKQGVTLVFELSGVNWNEVTDFLLNDGNPNSGVDEKRAWGFVNEANRYSTVDENMRFRGPNIARQRNGNLLLNGLIIFDVDALDPDSLAEGMERGRNEVPHIVSFMRENFAGFRNAEFVGHASRLYVRETRHFIGEYRLTINDVLENRDHWDRIGHARYPVDIQPTGPNNYGTIIGVPAIYSIPFRCLVPLGVEQLLIVGRSASFDSLAHGSARVMPIGMVSGQAAGTAVAYAVERGVTFREMTQNQESIRWLQNQLRQQGAFMIEYEPPRNAVMDHWAYPGLVVIRELGMASGGYSNDYGLDNYAPSRWTLQYRANRMMRVIHNSTEHRGENQIPAWTIDLETDDITVAMLLISAAELASLGDNVWTQRTGAAQATPMSFANAADARDYLINRNVLTPDILQHFDDFDDMIKVGQIISILGSLYKYLMGVA